MHLRPSWCGPRTRRGIPRVWPQIPPTAYAVTVTITVTDVNEAPEVTTTDTLITVRRDDSDDITAMLATYTAADPDVGAPTPTWSVGGADGSKFNIGNEDGGTPGELKFKKKPDYEKPTDANEDNVYEVTVQASDGKKTGMAEGDGLRRQRGGRPGW